MEVRIIDALSMLRAFSLAPHRGRTARDRFGAGLGRSGLA